MIGLKLKKYIIGISVGVITTYIKYCFVAYSNLFESYYSLLNKDFKQKN